MPLAPSQTQGRLRSSSRGGAAILGGGPADYTRRADLAQAGPVPRVGLQTAPQSPTQTPDAHMPAAIAEFLTRYRWPLLGVALLLGALAVVPASQLALDRSIESLYSTDDPRLLAYQESKRNFGGDEFVIVAYRRADLLASDGNLTPPAEADLKQLSQRLSSIAGVNKASTQDLASVFEKARQFTEEYVASLDSSFAQFLARRMAYEQRGRMYSDATGFSRGILIGEDNQTAAIVLRLLPEGTATAPRRETLRRLREIAAAHDPPAFVAGEPVQIHDAFDYVEDDGRRLFLVSLVLLSGVLLVLFRTPRWVLVPLAVTAAAVVWTRALLAISGAELSMVSSMLNSLVTIISVATVTHIAVRFRALRRRQLAGRRMSRKPREASRSVGASAGLDATSKREGTTRLDRSRESRIAALRRALSELAGPICWTVATTAAGFLSLIISDVMPVRSFGVMTALGTVMVLLGVTTIVPAATLLGSERTLKPAGETDSALARGLSRGTAFARRRGAVIAVLALLLTIGAGFGLTRLQVETDFSKNFRDDSPIVRSLDFIEAHLGGAGSWEVNVPAPATLDEPYLVKIRTLATRLRALEAGGQPVLTKVVAISDGLDLLPAVIKDENDVDANLAQIARLQPEFVPSLYNRETLRMRLVLRSHERQSAEQKRAAIAAVTAEAQRIFPDAKATGLFVLLTFLIESLLRDQAVSFTIAGVALAVMMLLAFRRPGLALAALIPNVLPILVLLGAMGWLGVPVNIGTAMIASISIGLTIDSSIHYLSAYRRARDDGADVAAALDETGRHVGVALVFATLALSVGFSVLCLSHFVPLIYFGVLVSLAMLGGLLGNLLLLPAVLPWVDGGSTVAVDTQEPVEENPDAPQSL